MPYGVYDLAADAGWVSVGVDHETAAFAVQTIRTWWHELGRSRHPAARRLTITADGGGSNGSRVSLWKRELQALADELGLDIAVHHVPPGTSKWNKIEHRLFSFISSFHIKDCIFLDFIKMFFISKKIQGYQVKSNFLAL